MLNSFRFKTVARITLAVLCVPLCLAGTCPQTPPPPPPPPGNTVLLSEMVASGAGVFVGADKCATPAGGDRGFVRTFNALAGKLVSVTVTGPVTNSRPQIRVVDLLATQVANTGNTPTTQTNTTTFTPSASQLFILQVQECANITVGSVYSVQVSQAP